MPTQIFKVKGMHCASCAAIISKKIGKLEGVANINVNYASEKAQIEFSKDPISLTNLNEQINKYGYEMTDEELQNNSQPADRNNNLSSQTRELASSELKAKISMPLSLIVFILMMWDIAAKTFFLIPPLPIPMEVLNAILMIIATIVMFWVGKPFISGVVRFLKYHVANMDTLVGIGTLTAYLYSVFVTLFPSIRNFISIPEYTYFDVTIVVIGFVTFGKYLESRSKAKTGEAVKKLLNLQAKTALVERNGQELEIPISEVIIGDIIIIKPGAKIPVDGIIIEGQSSIDESMITGESVPTDKKINDVVIGATLNKQGSFKFKTTKIGTDTLLSQIIKMVEEAQGSKAPIQSLADKISEVFVPFVLGVALGSLALWLLVGANFIGPTLALSYGILSFVGVLVIACPCALGLATPTAIIVGVGKGAENGILIKNAQSLERLSSVNTIVFDKTGTITKGKPVVTDIIPLSLTTDNQPLTTNRILQLAASIEKPSEHPLAQAIVSHTTGENLTLLKVEEFKAIEGIGVEGYVNKDKIYIHKPDISHQSINEITPLQQQGKTVAVVNVNNKDIGLIALSDTLKDEAKAAIEKLHRKGIKVILLTGDNHFAAEYIAKQAGIDEVIAEVLPNEKAQKIKDLQKKGRIVAMVGDGINDAPALVQADVGIAMATGTDIAIESAGITLLHGDIGKTVSTVTIARATIRTVKMNLFWAFIYNIIGIPVAAGLLYPIWGIILNPVFAGMAMAVSSVSVVSNSLLLKRLKI